MNHKENDLRKICFHCASVYELEDEETLTCPFCSKSIQLSEYERVMQSIRKAVFGGWTCRVEYENAENEGKRYYTEQCGELFNFVAVAIASGLIGNMSYDIVKKVFGKINSYLRRNEKNHEDKTLVEFLKSPEKIRKFAEYISAYYDEYEGVDAKTKNAIMEEVFVDHVSHIMDGLIRMKHKDIDIDKVMEDSPHTREEIMKMVLDIRNRVGVQQLEKCDFEEFWDDINEIDGNPKGM